MGLCKFKLLYQDVSYFNAKSMDILFDRFVKVNLNKENQAILDLILRICFSLGKAWRYGQPKPDRV